MVKVKKGLGGLGKGAKTVNKLTKAVTGTGTTNSKARPSTKPGPQAGPKGRA